MLLKGDDQLSDLLGVLLRFRENKIGFSADIKEMFLQVEIKNDDHHAQRFLWRNGNPEDQVNTYVMQVMTFGATCSPSCAQYVKNVNARKFETSFSRAVESNQLSSERSMELGQECGTEKVLGMWWNLITDSFTFSLKLNKGNKEILQGKRRPTKREVLRILMSIYDPLGLIANYLIYLKILLQQIWRSGISWDQPINDEQFEKWSKWLKRLPDIEKLQIPRCYLGNLTNWNDTKVQLHIFVDSSQDASAAVAAYLRIKVNETVECVLIGAKTRVAPIKLQTIPRLELDGAVLGARFAKNIKQHLSITIQRTNYWSDSSIVLSWIHSDDPRKLCKFVACRVTEIQENSIIENWRYVPTNLNPADDATKWVKLPSLNSSDRWFKGPELLYEEEDHWPKMIKIKEPEPSKELVNFQESKEQLIIFERFSSYRRLLHSMSYVYKFINKLKTKNEVTRILTSEELNSAKNILVKMVQNEFYHEEIQMFKRSAAESNLQNSVKKSSSLYKLSPYIDHDGILRVRGRIDKEKHISFDTKRPIILPGESHLTTLIIRDFHEKFNHRNHETVFNEIRQNFYVPKLRRTLNKVRNKCQFCKVMNCYPETPEMSSLPECRLATFTSPFTYTAVDYFGPIKVSVGRRTEKRWGALFTCLTIRAVHLEIAFKLDHDNFILCLKNFMNRRGKPHHIYCDRGTNFVAGERILREELRNIEPKLIAENLVTPEISFHFNPPLSPHMGGSWERLVKSVKIALYDALKGRTPTDPLLQSCLTSAENIVNSRPLTYLPLDSEQSEALTPYHFLVGSSNGDKPIGQLDQNAKVLKQNYLLRERFANHYWRGFVSEYIPELLLRPKWFQKIRPLKEGDIVVICDKDLPRCNWPKGRIIEITKASDGQVRRAKVQTATGIFVRPAVKLAVLSVDSQDGSRNGTASAISATAVPRGSVANK